MADYFDSAKNLINQGIYSNSFDENGDTTLMKAIRSKSNMKSIEKLIEKATDINSKNDDGDTALMIAALWENLEITLMLIENHANLDLQNNKGKTALHYACLRGKIELVYCLISNGADSNIQDNEGRTPLMVASRLKYFTICHLLIRNNAEVDVEDNDGETAWFHICDFPGQRTNIDYFNRNKLGFLKNYWANEDFLWYFEYYIHNDTASNYCKRLIELIEEYENIEQRYYGYSENYVEMKRYSIDTNINDIYLRLEDHYFEKHYYYYIMDLLAQSDWLDRANKQGQTPFIKAIECKADERIIEFFIVRRVDVLRKDNRGKPALYYALENQLFETAFYILYRERNLSLDCKYLGKGVYDLISECSLVLGSEQITACRNALIRELSNTFKYTDYEEFKERVLESIDNEQVILIESDHLKALDLISHNEKELDEVIKHLKSAECRERVIVDYLNFLNDKKELLESRKIQLVKSFSELEDFDMFASFGKAEFKLKELISEQALENLIDLIKSKTDAMEKKSELGNVIEIFNKYIRLIKTKISLGHELLKLIEG